jgi:hypothetical protein
MIPDLHHLVRNWCYSSLRRRDYAEADAGVHVRVVADACAGSDDASHEAALAVMRLLAPLVEVS